MDIDELQKLAQQLSAASGPSDGAYSVDELQGMANQLAVYQGQESLRSSLKVAEGLGQTPHFKAKAKVQEEILEASGRRRDELDHMYREYRKHPWLINPTARFMEATDEVAEDVKGQGLLSAAYNYLYPDAGGEGVASAATGTPDDYITDDRAKPFLRQESFRRSAVGGVADLGAEAAQLMTRVVDFNTNVLEGVTGFDIGTDITGNWKRSRMRKLAGRAHAEKEAGLTESELWGQSMVRGLVREGTKLLVTKGLGAATKGKVGFEHLMAYSSAVQANDTYTQARDAGMNPLTAGATAYLTGALTGAIMKKFQTFNGGRFAGSESIIARTMANEQAKRVVSGIPRHMMENVFGEIAEESLTEALIAAVEKTTFDPGMTWKDFGERMRDTVIQAGLISSTVAGSQAHRALELEKLDDADVLRFLKSPSPDVIIENLGLDENRLQLLTEAMGWTLDSPDDYSPSRRVFNKALGRPESAPAGSAQERQRFMATLHKAAIQLEEDAERLGHSPGLDQVARKMFSDPDDIAYFIETGMERAEETGAHTTSDSVLKYAMDETMARIESLNKMRQGYQDQDRIQEAYREQQKKATEGFEPDTETPYVPEPIGETEQERVDRLLQQKDPQQQKVDALFRQTQKDPQQQRVDDLFTGKDQERVDALLAPKQEPAQARVDETFKEEQWQTKEQRNIDALLAKQEGDPDQARVDAIIDQGKSEAQQKIDALFKKPEPKAPMTQEQLDSLLQERDPRQAELDKRFWKGQIEDELRQKRVDDLFRERLDPRTNQEVFSELPSAAQELLEQAQRELDEEVDEEPGDVQQGNIDQFGNDLDTRGGKLQSLRDEVFAQSIEHHVERDGDQATWSIFVESEGPSQEDLAKWNRQKHVAEVLGYEIGDYTFKPESGVIIASLRKGTPRPAPRPAQTPRDTNLRNLSKEQKGKKAFLAKKQAKETVSEAAPAPADFIPDSAYSYRSQLDALSERGSLNPERGTVDQPAATLDQVKSAILTAWDAKRRVSSKITRGHLSNKKGPPAKGRYNPATGQVDIHPHADKDFTLIMHELAHHIDQIKNVVNAYKRLPDGRWQKLAGSMPQDIRDKIKHFDYDQSELRDFEGFAEFLRIDAMLDGDWSRVTPNNPHWQNLVNLAQDIKPWFDNLMSDPDLKPQYDYTKKAIAEWIDATNLQRTAGLLEAGKPKRYRAAGIKGYMQGFRQIYEPTGKFIMRMQYDALHDLRIADKDAEREGVITPHQQMIINSARASHMAYASLETALYHVEVPVRRGEQSRPREMAAPALMPQIMAQVKGANKSEKTKDYDLAMRYVTALSLLEKKAAVEANGEDTYMLPVPANELQKLIDETPRADAARYKRITRAIKRHNNALVDILTRVGFHSEEEAARIKRFKYYVPNFHEVSTQRNTLSLMVTGGVSGTAGQGTSSPFKFLKKGSWEHYMDPVEATMQQTIAVYSTALSHSALLNLAYRLDPYLGGSENMGEYFAPVKTERKINQETLQFVVTSLEAAANKAGDVELKNKLRRWKAIWANGDWEAQGIPSPWSMLNVMAHDKTKPDVENLFITINVPEANGEVKRRTYRLAPEVWDGLTFAAGKGMGQIFTGTIMGMPWAGAAVDKFFAGVARFIRASATGINMGFGAINLLRDFLQYQITAKEAKGVESVYGPWRWFFPAFAYEVMTNLPIVGRKIKGTVPVHPIYALYTEASGGKLQTRIGYGEDLRKIKNVVREEAGLNQGWIKSATRTVGKFVEGMGDIVGTTDMGPRLTEYAAVIREAGYTVGKNAQGERVFMRNGVQTEIDEDTLLKATWAAADATTNFLRGGRVGRTLNRYIPFLNASLQGTYKLYQVTSQTLGGKRSKARFLTAAALAMATEWAYLMSVKDEEWYKEIPASERNRYYHNQDMFRLPKAHGSVLSNVMGAFVDMANGDKQGAERLVLAGLPVSGLDFPMSIPIFDEIVAQMKNEDTHFHTPIVPPNLVGLEPEAQFTDKTPEWAKALAKVMPYISLGTMDASPMRTQHFVDKFTAGILSRPKRALNPILRFKPPDNLNTARGRFYDAHEKVSMKLKTFRHLNPDEEPPPPLQEEFHRLNYMRGIMSDMIDVRNNKEEPLTDEEKYEINKVLVGTARLAMGYSTEQYPTILSGDIPRSLLPVRRSAFGRLRSRALGNNPKYRYHAKAARLLLRQAARSY